MLFMPHSAYSALCGSITSQGHTKHPSFKSREASVTAGSAALSVHYRENYTIARMNAPVLRGLGKGGLHM